MDFSLNDIIDYSKFKILDKYSIEFGILTEDGLKTLNVNILNSDDSISKMKLGIADVMYFTENGTLTIPGKHIFEKGLPHISRLINKELEDIVDSIIEKNIEKSDIENRLRKLTINIENYLKGLIRSIVKKNHYLGSLLDEKDKNQYLYDLSDLSKYIKCKLVIN